MRALARLAGALHAADERVLPPASARLRRIVAAIHGIGPRLLPPAQAWRTDPLGTIRRRPEAGVLASLLLVLALAAGALLDAWGAGPPAPPSPTASAPAAAPLTVVSLGPRAGERVAAYQARSARRLAAYARHHARTVTYAMVDLSGYLTAARVRALVGDRTVARAFVRAPVPGAPLHVVTVAGAAALPSALGQLSAQAAREAVGFSELLATLRQSSAGSNGAVLRVYEQRTAATQAEARALGPACACVYAVLVRADGRSLAALAGEPGVRVVDPAPAGSVLLSLATIALQPEERTVVPADEGFA